MIWWAWWRCLDKVLCHQLNSSQPAQQTQVGEVSWVGVIIFVIHYFFFSSPPPPPPQVPVFGGAFRNFSGLTKVKNPKQTRQNHTSPPKKTQPKPQPTNKPQTKTEWRFGARIQIDVFFRKLVVGFGCVRFGHTVKWIHVLNLHSS